MIYLYIINFLNMSPITDFFLNFIFKIHLIIS